MKSKKLLLAMLFVLSTITATTSYASNNQLNYCLEANPDKLDPTQSTSPTDPINFIYEALVKINPENGEPMPNLAESWQILNNGQIYKFKLRKGVQFQSSSTFKPTRELRAEDVVFSIERQLDKNSKYYDKNATFAWVESMSWGSLIKSVKAVDNYTVEIDLNRKDATFLYQMSLYQGYIFSKEYADKLMTNGKYYEDLTDNPIGTGQFMFVEYKKDDYIRLIKNEKYWGEKNNIDKINAPIVTDSSVRTAKLQTGECDVIKSLPFTAIPTLELDKNVEVVATNSTMSGTILINTEKPYLNNTYVRQAIEYAIDYDKMMVDIFNNKADRQNSIIPNNIMGHSKTLPLPTRNITKAKELMKKAGYPNGFKTKIWSMPVSRPYMPNSKAFAEIIQANLKEIGIDAEIVSYEWGAYLDKVYSKGEGDIILCGWTADVPEPDYFITPLYSCDSRYKNNAPMYCNKEFDNLTLKAKETTNLDTRKKYYQKIQEIFANDVPAIPLAQPKFYYGLNKNKIKTHGINDYYLDINKLNVK